MLLGENICVYSGPNLLAVVSLNILFTLICVWLGIKVLTPCCAVRKYAKGTQTDDMPPPIQYGTTQYGLWTIPFLKAELERRGLRARGSKFDLVNMLVQDDTHLEDPGSDPTSVPGSGPTRRHGARATDEGRRH